MRITCRSTMLTSWPGAISSKENSFRLPAAGDDANTASSSRVFGMEMIGGFGDFWIRTR